MTPRKPLQQRLKQLRLRANCRKVGRAAGEQARSGTAPIAAHLLNLPQICSSDVGAVTGAVSSKLAFSDLCYRREDRLCPSRGFRSHVARGMARGP